MYRLVLFLVLLISSCTPVDNSTLVSEYGEYYFSMDCIWRTYDDGQTLWWCSADVEVELMEGYLFLELLEDGRLSFCGENLILNTGYEFHDNLVEWYTRDHFNCITSEETELGNEFDWLWHKENRTLQLIWRIDEYTIKQLTLIIDAGRPVTTVAGKVYYKDEP